MSHDDLSFDDQLALLDLLMAEEGYEAETQETIPLVARDVPAPLSFSQQRLWFFQQMDPASATYNVPLALRLRGPLNRTALQQALDQLCRRHESLRTYFVKGQDGPRQQVAEDAGAVPTLREVDLRAYDQAEQEREIVQLADEEALRPFDLAEAPLVRAVLLVGSPTEHILLLTLHHIVCDGWSMGVLINEVSHFYQALVEGRHPELPALPIQYLDFAAWQNSDAGLARCDHQLAYWRERLAGLPPLLELPYDFPRPALQTFNGANVPISLDATLGRAVTALGRDHGATPFMVLAAAFQWLLALYSGTEDIAVGTPVANRNRAELEGLIGFFVNTVVIRAQVQQRQNFATLLGQVRDHCLDAFAHAEISFDQVVEALQPRRGLDHSPLFQVMFVLQNADPGTQHAADLQLETLTQQTVHAKYDLTLALHESPEDGAFHGVFEYNRDLFSDASMRAIATRFQHMLQWLVQHADRPMTAMPLCTARELAQLRDYNRLIAPPQSWPNLPAMLTNHARQFADQPILRDANGSLSYAEFHCIASRLAQGLIAAGVRPGEHVAVMVPRSRCLLTLLSALWQVGAVYVPLDPHHPDERRALILEDAGVKRVIHQGKGYTTAAVVWLDVADLARPPETAPQPLPSPAGDAPAYIIYTSGSTGRPKGTLLRHDALTRVILGCARRFDIEPGRGMACLASFAFDISLFELFLPLVGGGWVDLIEREEMLALDQLCRRLADTHLLHAVPSLMREIINHLEESGTQLPLTHLFVGGDAVPPQLLRDMRTTFPNAAINELYGPTETTILASAWPVDDRELHGDRLIIGTPLDHAELLIVDRDGRMLPPGIAGEICIGGLALAVHYHDRPALTADKYRPHGFSDEAGTRLYHTGDLGRILPDPQRGFGNIEFLGRLDQQVKIRGFRIELGEIEAVLVGHEAVAEAVVCAVALKAGEAKQLAAYLVLEENEGAENHDWRNHVAARLPDYMVPAFFIHLPTLPLNANGKVDRKALPVPSLEQRTRPLVAARDELERDLVALFQAVLQHEPVGIEDNFFELGGHSLSATRLVDRIRTHLNVVVAVRDLFEKPTPAALADTIRGAGLAALAAPRPADRNQVLPLSFSQTRLWFLEQLGNGGAAYHIPVVLTWRGRLDVAILRESLSLLSDMHESLRTCFQARDGEPFQRIEPRITPPLTVVNADEGLTRESWIADQTQRPFTLSEAPLWRVGVYCGSETLLTLTLHHIIADGWSMDVLMRDWLACYRYAAGLASAAPQGPALQYADFAVHQRQTLDDTQIAADTAWWRETLREVPPLLNLPLDRPRRAGGDQRGGQVPFTLAPQTATLMKQLAQREQTTLFTVLTAAWGLFLGRLSGQKHVAVGTADAGRDRAEWEAIVGFFANTHVIACDLSERPNFRTLVRRLHQHLGDQLTHRGLPFERLVELLDVPRDLGTSPLFQAMIVLQNTPQGSYSFPGFALEPVAVEQNIAKFDLTLVAEEDADRIHGSLEYACALFDQGTALRFVAWFENLCSALVTQPNDSVHGLPMLPADDLRLVTETWNQSSAVSLPGDHVLALFDAVVAKRGTAPAVKFGTEALSYAELAARAEAVALVLVSLGLTRDQPVAMYVPNAPTALVGLLAILRAGGCYLPLDPDYPTQRLQFMLADSDVSLVVCNADQAEAVRALRPDARLVFLDQPLDPPSAETRLPELLPGQAAYLIYTSGSTGTPKAVSVSHANLKHSTAARFAYYREPLERFLLLSSLSFDSSVAGLFWTLTAGGCLLLTEPETRRNPDAVADLIAAESISHTLCVPSLYRLLPNDRGQLKSLRCAIVAGETCPSDLPFHPGVTLYNEYGPTEASVWCSVYRLHGGEQIVPIGQPIAATRLYILDELLQPQPPGVAGELYVAGAGVSRGYRKAPAATAAKFLPDPFSSRAGARMYRTGDRARYRTAPAEEAGQIEFLGRLDHQIKVRGFRIEPGEIEAVLCETPCWREAKVMARRDNGGAAYLAAYLLLDPDQQREDDPGARLRRQLPHYMVPTRFTVLEQFPRTANGKLDVNALPEPTVDARPYSPPQNEAEQRVAEIWREVLGCDPVGRHDNFFALGGHSLLVTRVLARLRDRFAADLSPRDLFAHPDLADFAGLLAQTASREPHTPVTVVARDGYLPLSSAQERLWFLDHLEPNQPTYLIPAAFRLTGPLDPTALRDALHRLMQRHETLRTRFGYEAGRPFQQVDDTAVTPLVVVDPRDEGAQTETLESWVREAVSRDVVTPFALDQAPLWRVRLYRLSQDKWVISLVLHHIIGDAWSMQILWRELSELYRACRRHEQATLPALQVQYIDYAAWQRRHLTDAVLNRQRDYWVRQLADAPTLLALETDKPRPRQPRHRGALVPLHLSETLTQRLNHLCRMHDCTLFMAVSAAYAVMLGRYAGVRDVLIGTPFANRDREVTEHLIGFFVNTLVLRFQWRPNIEPTALLAQTRQMLLDAYAHADVPFERLVEVLQPQRDSGRSPLFQAAIAMQDDGGKQAEAPALGAVEVSEQDFAYPVAKYELVLNLDRRGATLQGNLMYDADLFEAATVQAMADHFTAVLTWLVDAEDHSARIPGPSTAEQQQLLAFGCGAETALTGGADNVLQQIFAHVQQRKDDEAVACGAVSLSYAQLWQRAALLASVLQAQGLQAEQPVAILTARDANLVVAILAVLLAGGCYMPMDPAYPRERLNAMVAGAKPALLLCDTASRRMPEGAPATIALDDFDWEAVVTPQQASLPAVSRDQAALLLFTSGTTGVPKGIVLTHGNILNLAHNHQLPFGPGERMAQVTTISFDPLTWELWTPLCAGGCVDVIPRDVVLDAARLADTLVTRRIKHMVLATALFHRLAESRPDMFNGLNTLLFGGEKADPNIIASVKKAGGPRRILNGYGPAEASTFCSLFEMKTPLHLDQDVPLGHPADGTQLYLVDDHMQLVPRGAVGEIVIGGAGVGRGFAGQPGLTADHFRPDPFSPAAGARCYRSGDFGRWDLDGTLRFLGRRDSQLKIRGRRVETREIETVLTQAPGVRQALVRTNGKGNQTRLIAYITVDETYREAAVKAYLEQRLSAAMMPQAWIPLDAFPLTPNGKTDEKALAERIPATPARHDLAAYEPAHNELEQQLCDIWQAVLNLPQCGRNDDFFALGGHSLPAMQVIDGIEDRLGWRPALADLFASPTPAGLALRLQQQAGQVEHPIQAVTRTESHPLSHAQQRMWFLAQMPQTGAAYHIPIVFDIRGEASPERLHQACRLLQQRHEPLRTAFITVDGSPRQVILAEAPLDWTFRVASAEDDVLLSQTDRRLLDQHASQPFDLEAGSTFRVLLLQRAPQRWLLQLTVHHIVADGRSMEVLLGELAEIYDALSRDCEPDLPSLPLQYVDYAHWSRRRLDGPAATDMLSVWSEILAGSQARTALPYDVAPLPEMNQSGANVAFHIAPALARRLTDLGRQQGATPFMTYLAAFALWLSHYCESRDLPIGTPYANRDGVAWRDLPGFFANTLVLRCRFEAALHFNDVLAAVRDTATLAFKHAEMPFEKLVETLLPNRDPSVTPLFQVMFTMQHAMSAAPAMGDLQLQPLSGENSEAKFALTMALSEHNGGYEGRLEYRTALFQREQVESFAQTFGFLLETLVDHPETPLQQLPLVSPAMQRRLLEDWGRGPQLVTPFTPLHQRLTQVAATHPEAPALIDGDTQMTFAALETAANRLAGRIQRLGLPDESLVGLCLERGPIQVLASLAVLKAGLVMALLDPEYPAERLATMTASMDLVLCSAAQEAGLGPDVTRMVLPATLAETACWTEPAVAPSPVCHPQQLAYVVHTSGSTGRPKGVAVNHAALANLTDWYGRDHGGAFGERVAVLAGPGFDATVMETLPNLALGACLVFPDETVRLDPKRLAHWLADQAVARCFAATPLAEALLAETPPAHAKLRQLLTGGDRLHIGKSWGSATLVNVYGPTETTVVVSTYRFDEAGGQDPVHRGLPPIGYPVGNSELLVLDEHLRLLPPGAPGELYIGGPCLARGYLGQAAQTAARFVPHPFATGARLYRTGDKVCWREGGATMPGRLAFLGRNDDQVQIHGMRIELGDIEQAILAQPGVAETVVKLWHDEGRCLLVAYYVVEQGAAVDQSRLRGALSRCLPRHMVPQQFRAETALPKTANGKFDRRALSRPELPTAQEKQPLKGEIGRGLTEIWSELLGTEALYADDDFFVLGGHSLLVASLGNRIKARFGVRLPLNVFFQATTAGELATQIEQADAASPVTDGDPLLWSFSPETQADAPTLFLIHPVGGSPACYQDLAEALAPAWRVIGLQAPPLAGLTPADTLPAMAERLHQAIRAAQPTGPYYLGGWSLGGILALECARFLSAEHHPVTLLMIDSVRPSQAMQNDALNDARLWTTFALDLGVPVEVVTAAQGPAALLQWAHDHQLLPQSVGLTDLQPRIDVIRHHLNALADYQPAVYGGTVHLIRAAETGDDHADPDGGWSPILTTLHQYQSDGHHFSMVRQPAVQGLSAVIRTLLHHSLPAFGPPHQ